MTDWMGEKAFGSVDDVGVRTQVEPAKSSRSAPSGPSCSDPAIGCPPTKRGVGDLSDDRALDAANVGDHELARPIRTRSAFTSATMAATGVATKATVARWSTPISSTAPSSWARRARTSSRSLPVTHHPWARSARAIEVPTNPRPVTCARCEMTAGPVEASSVGRSSRSPRALSRYTWCSASLVRSV